MCVPGQTHPSPSGRGLWPLLLYKKTPLPKRRQGRFGDMAGGGYWQSPFCWAVRMPSQLFREQAIQRS